MIDKSSVLEFIKNSGKPVRRDDIIKATGYSGDFKYCIKVLKKEHDEIQSVGSNNDRAYIWKPTKALFSEVKNKEGYNDFTAGKAIANVMKGQIQNGGKYPMRQKYGEIWSTSNVVDDQEGLLIVSAKENTCIGYSVYPQKKSFMKPDYTMRWTNDSGTHYISTINPINCSEKKLTKKIYTLKPEEQECLRVSLINALGIEVPSTVEVKIKEVPVEKIVEKVVEKKVPIEVVKTEVVEKVVEKEVFKTNPMEIDLAVYKAKCEIYEKLLFVDGGSRVAQELQLA